MEFLLYVPLIMAFVSFFIWQNRNRYPKNKKEAKRSRIQLWVGSILYGLALIYYTTVAIIFAIN